MRPAQRIIFIVATSLAITLAPALVPHNGCGNFPDALCQYGWPYTFYSSGGIAGLREFSFPKLLLNIIIFTTAVSWGWWIVALSAKTTSKQSTMRTHLIINSLIDLSLGVIAVTLILQRCYSGLFIGLCELGDLISLLVFSSLIIWFTTISTLLRHILNSKNKLTTRIRTLALYSISLVLSIVLTILSMIALATIYVFTSL